MIRQPISGLQSHSYGRVKKAVWAGFSQIGREMRAAA